MTSKPSTPSPAADEGAAVHRTGSGIAFVRTPDERFAKLPGYPFEPRYVEIDGLRMHYVDEGPRDGQPVLMLHGQPTWSYLYRKMIPGVVAAGHRAIAPDLIGMGRSDKPTSLTLHSLRQHVAWVSAFVDALGLRDVTLFGQDWGSLIGLRLVGERPDVFARVLIANGQLPEVPAGVQPFSFPDRATARIDHDAPAFSFAELKREMARAESPTAAFSKWIVYALTSPAFTASGVVEANTLSTLSPEELAAYDAPFPSPIYMAGPRTLPAMAGGMAGENGPAWRGLERFEKPFLTVFGEQDPLLGTEAGQRALTGRIPGAKGQPHERVRADHFIQEDQGPLLAERLNAFIAANPVSRSR